MKITIAVLFAGLLNIAGIKAQTIPEGINHLYAERYKSAKEIFEKLVATNPNNLEAVYWLGQADIELQDVKSARDLYSKTLQANGSICGIFKPWRRTQRSLTQIYGRR